MDEYIRYMSAWIRLNCPVDCSVWTDQEIVDSFALLPFPAKKFEEWRRFACGGDEEQKEENVTRLDPLERLKSEGGNLFKQGIVRLGA